MTTDCEHPKLADEDYETIWKCPGCDHVFTDESDMAPIRECSNDTCGTIFVSEDRPCPQCNRPFTRRLGDHGCTECEGEDECEEQTAAHCEDCDGYVEKTA